MKTPHHSISTRHQAGAGNLLRNILALVLVAPSGAFAHDGCVKAEAQTARSSAKLSTPSTADKLDLSVQKVAAQSARGLDLAPAIPGINAYSVAAIAVPSGIAEEIEIQIPFEGQLETIRLFRTSMRRADFRVLVDVGGGKLVEEPAPPHRTYRGSRLSDGMPVAATIVDGRLWAMIPTDDDTIWVQPSSDFFAGRAANEHIVYRRSALSPLGEHRCGLDEAGLGLPDWMQGVANDPAESNGSVNGGGEGEGGGDGSGGGGDGGVAGTSPFIAKIAFDADYEFFQRNGSNVSNTVNDIETVMNNVTLVYDRDVNISYEYTTVVVRATAADPYTTTVMTDLLCEFRTKWNSLPESEISRDVAQLFTGKTIQGSVIGLAWLGVLCNQQGNDCGGFGNLAYSAVESRFSGVADFRTSLSAHELGHNWQAQHCDAVSPCNIMCATLNGCQGTTGVNLKFSTSEQNQIIGFRNAVACDVALPAPLTIPWSDNFESPAINQINWIYNKGAAISTAALNEPSPTRSLVLNSTSANEYADDQIRSNFFLLGGQSVGIVGYFVQRNGVESGEQLVVEYFNNQLKWQVLNTITSDGINQSTFTEFSHNLPANALHNKFRLRFRTLGDQADDNWYIDNVSVVAVVIPANDDCVNAIQIGAGTLSFNNANATNSATTLPASCDGGVGTTMQKDIWYLFTAPCTGTATASTCGTTAFNSRLAVYNLICPPTGSFLGCNNDDPACANGGASVTFNVVEGSSYHIRVGANTTGGAGTLTMTCTAIAPCPADLSGDGFVNGEDLAAVLGAWGTPNADVNDDGTTDGSDLAIVLGGWGECP
ncbi:MAG: hypothetical protein RLY21_984 [Planctomycetota bacterium]|jgi:hypothetical protein